MIYSLVNTNVRDIHNCSPAAPGEEKGLNYEESLMVKAAWYYYFENMTQQAIADRLSISRMRVIKLLETARQTGVIQFRLRSDGVDMEELILELIDFNVEDEFDEDDEEGTITIYGDDVKAYAQIQKFLEEQGFEDIGGEFTYVPNDLKDLDAEQRATINKMVERLEEFDDVQNVYTNMKPEEAE